jgi:cytoskeletal protein CcmA (bactofilin family)
MWLVAAPAQAEHRPSDAVDDVIAADEQVDLREAAQGAAILAGSRVRLAGPVTEDALLAGGEVSVEDRVGGDLYAVGGAVRVSSAVDGSARLAGGKVSLGRTGSIAGRVTIAAGEVDLSGRLAQSARIVADTVRVDGEIGGNLRVAARKLIVGPAAQIGGRLVYTSPEPGEISPSAVIGGGIEFRHGEEPRSRVGPALRVLSWVAAVVALLGLLLLGVMLILLFPGFSAQTARVIATEPGKSLALGFALLASLPMAGVVLLITVIGIPLGLAVLLAYPVLLLVGYLTAGLCLGDALAAALTRGSATPPGAATRIGGLTVALIGLTLAASLPYLGWVLLLAAIVAGAGALSLRLYRAYAAPSPPAA